MTLVDNNSWTKRKSPTISRIASPMIKTQVPNTLINDHPTCDSPFSPLVRLTPRAMARRLDGGLPNGHDLDMRLALIQKGALYALDLF
jgi:hypothetical protein